MLVGARTPADLLFLRELEDWRGRFDVDLDVTVDSAGEDWHGRVGVVTQLDSAGARSTPPMPSPSSAAPS